MDLGGSELSVTEASSSNDTQRIDNELVKKLEECGLDPYYWGGKLQNEFGITRHTQLLHLNANNRKKLEAIKRYDWEIIALQKLIPNNESEQDAKGKESKKQRDEFIEKLKSHGLNSDWANTFEKELGVNSTAQLKYLSKKDIDKLEKSRTCVKEWEKKALSALLNAENSEDKTLSTTLKSVLKERNDELKSSANTSKAALDVKDQDWVAPSQTVNIQNALSAFQSQSLSNTINRPDLPDSDVIEHASGGRALKGIYSGSNMDYNVDVRKQVIQVATALTFKGPSIQQEVDYIDFTSKDKSDNFHKCLKTTGKEFTGTATFQIMGYGADMRISASSHKSYNNQRTDNSELIYQSREKYAFIPVKSCSLNLKDIRIVPEAINKLKEIEHKLLSEKNLYSLMLLCREFFEEYGSHINIGDLHFGGIYRWKATFSSRNEDDKVSCETLVQDSLNGFLTLGLTGLKSVVGVGISGSCLADEIEISKKYKKSELSKVELKILPEGGPPDEEDFQKWKTGLVSQNKTWSLIAREKVCGLWDVFANHQSDFYDSKHLAIMLESAWNIQIFRMGLATTEPTECILLLQLFCENIERLSQLQFEQCSLANFLKSDVKILDFFEMLAKSKTIQEEINLRNIRYQLRVLLKPLRSEFFPDRPNFVAWIKKENENYKDFPSILSLASPRNIDDLIKLLQDKFLPQIKAMDFSTRLEDKKSFEEYVTNELAQTFRKLLLHLKESNVKEFAILVSFLAMFRYIEGNGFPRLLSLKDVEEFIKEIKTRMNKYWQTKDGFDVTVQASLVEFIILNITKYTYSDSAKFFDSCFVHLKTVLDDPIIAMIGEHTTGLVYNWEQLIHDLQSFTKGKEREQLSFPIEHIQRIASESKSENQKLQHLPLTLPDNIIHLVEKLGMSKFTQNKLQFMDVIEINPRPSKFDRTCLPWFFIKTIMMQNSSIYQALESFSNQKEDPNDSESASDDDNDFLNFGTDDINKTIDISPLDLTVAVFVCCSESLKQTLASKMFCCRLAVPIILPQKNADQKVLSLGILRTTLIAPPGSSEMPATDCPCNIMSFVRIGRPKCSKSKIINGLISNDNHHTFFNIDAPLGTMQKSVSDGVVETTFFIPNVHETNKNMTMLFNLRGDAISNRCQMQILSKLSSAIVVFTEIDKLENLDVKKCIQGLSTSVSTIVLCLDARSKSKEHVKNITDNFLSSATPECTKRIKFVILSVNGEERVITDINKDIFKRLRDVLKVVPENSITAIAKRAGCIVDDQFQYLSEKKDAKTMVSIISDLGTSAKAKIVPLQLHPLYAISKNLKKMYKPSEYKTPERKEEIRLEISNIRRKQFDMLNDIHSFMTSFLGRMVDSLDSNESSNVVGFVGWLKLLLEQHSRVHIPEKHSKYKSDKQLAELAMENENTEKDDRLNKVVNNSEFALLETSFTFDHMIRELGQIYETVDQRKSMVKTETLDLVQKFPLMAAKLLLSGIPFELLNGDVIHVSTIWVKSVLQEVQKIIGDKRCLILSIIGTQSSGKSTLLNSMFGLQFPVGHGRITKGAFMQIIPVNDKSISFEYILVIDTEGLRAPERGSKNFMYDNEFATFVIGLADITIVNINGEFSSEMKDVLQMVVYALLRLKVANDNLNIKQKCVFVHQNVVTSTGDNSELKYTLQKTMETLDEMTLEAADHVGVDNVGCFKDVIHFDEKHVWYMPNLFAGTSQNTHINPSYSLETGKIKNAVLYDVAQPLQTFFAISDVVMRIDDLWHGILTEDFAHSFVCTLEAKAFDKIDRFYNESVRTLDRKMFQFVQNQRCSLTKCKDEGELNSQLEKAIAEIPDFIHEHSMSLRADFESYVEENAQSNIMIKWKQLYLTRIDTSLQTIAEKTTRGLRSVKEEIELGSKCEKVIKECEMEINELATQLADEVKNRKPTVEYMEEKFEENWIFWLTKSSSKYDADTEQPGVIAQKIKHLVLEKNRSEMKYMGELDTLTPETCSEFDHLLGTVSFSDIENNRHIYIDRDVFSVQKEKTDICKHKAVNFTDSLFQRIGIYLSKLSCEDTKFHDVYMDDILNIIEKQIKSFNEHKNNDEKFKFQMPYKILILKKVTGYCIKFFVDLNKNYNMSHSPRTKLEEYRATAWKLFVDLVQRKAEDVIASNFFQEAIRTCVTEYLSGVVPTDVEDEMIHNIYKHSKHEVMKSVKKDLVEKDEFKYFSMYISSPEIYVEQWLITVTNNTLFSKTENAEGVYESLCQPRINAAFHDVMKAINTATVNVMGKRGNLILGWVDYFISNLSLLPVPKDKMLHVESRNVTDIENFRRVVEKQLMETKENIFEEVRNTTCESFRWKKNPYTQIFENLWGCCENCPFCNEPCEQTGKDHLKAYIRHSCRQHRPQGIGDVALDSGRGPLVTDNCNYLIQTNQSVLDNTNTLYKYRHYRQKFPEWEISPSLETSKYWMWFFNKYQHEIARQNNAQPPNIPNHWKKITKRDALDTL